jgi:hypothetical protein
MWGPFPMLFLFLCYSSAVKPSSLAPLLCVQVKGLLAGALAVAASVITSNKAVHDGLSELLVAQERLEGEALQNWLVHVQVL